MRSTSKAAENYNGICAQTPSDIRYIIGLQYYVRRILVLLHDTVNYVFIFLVNSFFEDNYLNSSNINYVRK